MEGNTIQQLPQICHLPCTPADVLLASRCVWRGCFSITRKVVQHDSLLRRQFGESKSVRFAQALVSEMDGDPMMSAVSTGVVGSSNSVLGTNHRLRSSRYFPFGNYYSADTILHLHLQFCLDRPFIAEVYLDRFSITFIYLLHLFFVVYQVDSYSEVFVHAS